MKKNICLFSLIFLVFIKSIPLTNSLPIYANLAPKIISFVFVNCNDELDKMDNNLRFSYSVITNNYYANTNAEIFINKNYNDDIDNSFSGVATFLDFNLEIKTSDKLYRIMDIEVINKDNNYDELVNIFCNKGFKQKYLVIVVDCLNYSNEDFIKLNEFALKFEKNTFKLAFLTELLQLYF